MTDHRDLYASQRAENHVHRRSQSWSSGNRPWCHWGTVWQHCWPLKDSSPSGPPHTWQWNGTPETYHSVCQGHSQLAMEWNAWNISLSLSGTLTVSNGMERLKHIPQSVRAATHLAMEWNAWNISLSLSGTLTVSNGMERLKYITQSVRDAHS